MIKSICEVCKKEFIHYRSEGKGRFCSKICYQKAWRTITKNPRKGRDSRIKKECKVCKNIMLLYPSLMKQEYCSRNCRASTQKGISPSSHPNYRRPAIPPMLGKKNPNATFKKGMVSFNKGKKFPERSGKNHYNWKGGITKENDMQRVKFKREYQKSVLERDNYICQRCHKKGGYLQVNHIKSWADYPELRFDINNCETLCQRCHYFITYGKELKEKFSSWGNNFNGRWLT